MQNIFSPLLILALAVNPSKAFDYKGCFDTKDYLFEKECWKVVGVKTNADWPTIVEAYTKRKAEVRNDEFLREELEWCFNTHFKDEASRLSYSNQVLYRLGTPKTSTLENQGNESVSNQPRNNGDLFKCNQAGKLNVSMQPDLSGSEYNRTSSSSSSSDSSSSSSSSEVPESYKENSSPSSIRQTIPPKTTQKRQSSSKISPPKPCLKPTIDPIVEVKPKIEVVEEVKPVAKPKVTPAAGDKPVISAAAEAKPNDVASRRKAVKLREKRAKSTENPNSAPKTSAASFFAAASLLLVIFL